MEFPELMSSIILALSTIVLVIVTAYYAKQTRETVKVLKTTAELSIRPYLKGTFQQIGPVAGDLMIKNIGNGPANKIELSYWIEGNDSTKRNWTKPLMMPNEFDEFFFPKNEKDHAFDHDYFKNNQTTMRIVGKYYDVLDKEHKIDDTIDITSYVKQWEKTSVRYQEPLDKEIEKELAKISRSVDSINNEFRGFRRFFENKSNS